MSNMRTWMESFLMVICFLNSNKAFNDFDNSSNDISPLLKETLNGSIQLELKSPSDLPKTMNEGSNRSWSKELEKFVENDDTELNTTFHLTETNGTLDVLNVSSVTESFIYRECHYKRCFYHNITIATDVLPPLLKPAFIQSPIRMLMKDRHIEEILNDSFTYEIKDFLFLRRSVYYFASSVSLYLAIFSESFDDILNRKIPTGWSASYYHKSTPELASNCNLKGRCSSQTFKVTPQCYCDSLCHIYNDCCINYQSNFSYTSEVGIHSTKKTFMSCVENEYTSNKTTAGYWMVSRCPHHQPYGAETLSFEQYTSLRNRCEMALDDAYLVPVVSTKTGLHYRNAYCALCHDEDGYVYWSQAIPLKLSRVVSVYPPSDYKARVCFNFTFSECPPTVEKFQYGKYFSKLCSSHQNPVELTVPLDQANFPNMTASLSVHRNLYCFICNTRYMRLFAKVCYRDSGGLMHQFAYYGWLFHKEQKLILPNRWKSRCQSGEVWRSFLNKCVKLHCPLSTTPKNGGCEDVVISSDIQFYTLTFYISGNVRNDVYQLFIARLTKASSAVVDGGDYILVKPFRNISRVFSLIYRRKSMYPFNVSMSHLLQISKIKQWTFKYFDAAVDIVSIPALTKHPFLNMTMVDLNTFKEDGYLIKSIGEYLKEIDGHLTNHSIICYPTPQQRRHQLYGGDRQFETCTFSSYNRAIISKPNREASVVEIVLTYLSMGLSSVSFFVTLFCGVTKSSKQPSSIKRMLFHCIFVKLLSQVTFLVGCGANDIKQLCYFIGVLLHYLWLSSFVWSSICAYFFYCVFVLAFHSMKSITMTRTSSILGFVLVGYLLPLAIVILSVIVDILKHNETDSSYGYKICFITGNETLLFAFGYPIFYMILFNIICFATTILSTARQKTLIACWKEKFNRYFPVCVKMSFLLGFTWSIGFLARWLNNSVIWFVFILMDGVQGCLFCVSMLRTWGTVSSKQKIIPNRKEI